MGITQTLRTNAALLHGETRLVRDAKAGDKLAFDELVTQELGDLRNFIASKVCQDDVDDIAQDVLLSAWKAIAKFDGRSKFRTWIFGICVHKIKDYYRKQSKRIDQVSLDSFESDAVTMGAGDQAVLSHVVRSYIQQLTPSQFEVIELYYQQKLTLAEVANVLDRNINTVKYQFCQAHSRLAKAMKDGGF